MILRRSRALLDLAGIILDPLFYRPLDQDRAVELIRVVHGARDLRRILGSPA